MRRLFYFIVLLVNLALVASCSYDDKSTYTDTSKKDFYIDTTGYVMRNYVDCNETFTFSPSINYQDFNPDNFSYQWDITVAPVTSDTSAPNTFSADYITISTEKDLVWLANNTPSQKPYILRLTVTNMENGQKNKMVWYLYINAPSTKGFMVAYSANGTTSDLALVIDPVFNTAATDLSIRTKCYSTANGEEFPGIVYNLLWKQDYPPSGLLTEFLWLNSTTHIAQIDVQTQKVYRKDEELFFDYAAQKPLKDAYIFCGYEKLSQTGVIRLYNDGGFWQRKASSATNKDVASKWAMCYYGMRAYVDDRPGTTADDYDYDPIPPIAEGKNTWAFFDKKGYRFAKVQTSNETTATVAIPNTDKIPQFDPSVLKDWTPIYGGAGGGASNYFFVMKNGSNYALACLTATKYTKWIDITDAPEIDKAVCFESAVNQYVLFYGTSTGKLYSIYADPKASHVYSTEYDFGAPITKIRCIRNLLTTLKLPNFDEKSLLIGTSTGQTNGTLYLVMLDNIGTGHIKKEGIKKYDIPGKITAVCNIN